MSSATPPAPGPTRLPIDTSGIELPAGIHALMEALARSNHDVRAQRRLAVGSTRGSERNAASRYSDLLPFDALADDEKEHERQTAIETLKTIISLGYGVASSRPGADVHARAGAAWASRAAPRSLACRADTARHGRDRRAMAHARSGGLG